MKICLINNLYKPFSRGGAERVVEMIAFGLRSNGYEVVTITTKPLFKKLYQVDKGKVYYINSLFYYLDSIPKSIRLFFHIFDLFNIRKFLKVKIILKQEMPSAVMTHNLKGIGYLLPKAITSLKIKHIHTLHDIQLLHPSGLVIHGKEKIIDSRLAKAYQLINKKLFNSIPTIISPSEWLLKEHTKRGFFIKSTKEIIPNPVALKTYTKTNKEKINKLFRFLYVGQIEKHKGIELLLKAYDEFLVRSQSKDCQLLVIGRGLIVTKVKKHSLHESSIVYLGLRSHKEVLEYMQITDCLIVPSLCYENSPTVIYEAFAQKLPVLASRIGGIPEIVNDPRLLFESDNKKDLILKMRWAVKNREVLDKLGKRGRKTIEDYNIDSYLIKLIKIIS